MPGSGLKLKIAGLAQVAQNPMLPAALSQQVSYVLLCEKHQHILLRQAKALIL